MKKTCRFLTFTAMMAVVASLAVPAFAASEPGENEGTPSFFSSFVGQNHIVVNPAAEEATTSTTGTAAPATEGTAPTTTVDASVPAYTLGGGWMNFPAQADNNNDR
ncbi:hypothetical protein EDM59_16465 [Brevibacillus nitrificans]|uniref:Secreted protein n=1 Tax=Brevibacillus nitrificans TaxID=651560 RepID=A0A3M8D830_9BACL|nr:hypothetical protein [Brevibacillus nitrificans]RNB84098.1 hypothetical protein EDM59_16465 [Brevibacillus nitrificans]